MKLKAFSRIGLLAALLPLSSRALAGNFSTSGSSGPGAYSQNFSYSHTEDLSRDRKDDTGARIYSASYTFTRTEVGSTSGVDTRTYNQTHSVSGGIGFIEAWRYGGRITYTDTPAEYLSSFGAGFYGAWDFNDESDDEVEPTGWFTRPWGIRADLGYSEYSMNVSGTRPSRRPGGRATQSRTSNLRIGQASVEGSAWVDATDWVSFRLSHTRYLYTKNVSSFMAVLDDPRAIASGASQFGSTLSGFSSHGWDGGLDFTAPLRILLSLGGSLYTSASSGVLTRGYSAEISRSFSGFTPGLSWDRYVSNGDQQDLFGFSLSWRL